MSGDSVYNAPFRFVTINEDLRADDARRFLATFSFTFPVMMGGGDVKARRHYP
ncbi:MAG: hypothetical protein ABIZ91_19250 [Gemmatimonadaceae bacterium]